MLHLAKSTGAETRGAAAAAAPAADVPDRAEERQPQGPNSSATRMSAVHRSLLPLCLHTERCRCVATRRISALLSDYNEKQTISEV